MKDDSQSDGFISSHDFHILRKAFKASIAEGLIKESRWVQHARDLVRQLTGQENADESLISRIIER